MRLTSLIALKEIFFPRSFSSEKRFAGFFPKKFLTLKFSLKNHYKKSPEYSPGSQEKSGLSRAGTNSFHWDHYR
jgi:hypothetical protein